MRGMENLKLEDLLISSAKGIQVGATGAVCAAFILIAQAITIMGGLEGAVLGGGIIQGGDSGAGGSFHRVAGDSAASNAVCCGTKCPGNTENRAHRAGTGYRFTGLRGGRSARLRFSCSCAQPAGSPSQLDSRSLPDNRGDFRNYMLSPDKGSAGIPGTDAWRGLLTAGNSRTISPIDGTRETRQREVRSYEV